MADGSVTLPLPTGTTVKVVGITNSAWWPQMIILETSSGQTVNWTGVGAQDNHLVGQVTLPPSPDTGETLKVWMQYDAGEGWRTSAVKVDSYNMDGLEGYVVGGQDGGGRPDGGAYWNTLALVYWAPGY